MSSPKGNSKHPQSFMYKDGESKLVEQSEVEEHMADGWCDNPDEEAPAVEEVTEPEEGPEDGNTPDDGEGSEGPFDGLLDGTAEEIKAAVADFNEDQIAELIVAEEAGNTRHNVMEVLHDALAVAGDAAPEQG